MENNELMKKLDEHPELKKYRRHAGIKSKSSQQTMGKLLDA